MLCWSREIGERSAIDAFTIVSRRHADVYALGMETTHPLCSDANRVAKDHRHGRCFQEQQHDSADGEDLHAWVTVRQRASGRAAPRPAPESGP